MNKSARILKFKTKPGKREEVWRVWERHARDYVAASNRTLSFVYGFDDSDPDGILVFQLAADQTSAQEFMEQPWFADYQRETAAFLAGPPEAYTATPIWVKEAANLVRA